jgi:transcription-repair coupling factor (superfamily II helicase)
MTANLLNSRPAAGVAPSPAARALAEALLDARASKEVLARLDGGHAVALAEVSGAARPAVLAALAGARARQMLCVVPTGDVAERIYADSLYYAGAREDAPASVALLRARGESFGAIQTPSERSARIDLFEHLAAGTPLVVLASVAAVRERVLSPQRFAAGRLELARGESVEWESLLRSLHDAGYERVDVVGAVGEYAVRGGIVDCYPATAVAPVRIEFFGDTIESIRAFDLESQRSHTELQRVSVAPWNDAPGDDETATVLSYLRRDATVVLDDPSALDAIERALSDEERLEEGAAAPHVALADLAGEIAARPTLVLPGGIAPSQEQAYVPAAPRAVLECRPAEHFNRQIERFTDAVRQWTADGQRVAIVTTAVTRMVELLDAAGIAAARGGSGLPYGSVVVDAGSLESGFVAPQLRLVVLGDREIFGLPPKRVKLRAVKEGVPVTLSDLRVGDFVVHAVHGISRYEGLRTETILGATQDYLDLHFAGSDRMLVPVTQMHQVTKYASSDGGAARLSRMGGGDWARTKARVSESLSKIVDGLVELYAERELAGGYAFGADTPWQAEVEEAFPYELTPDQRTAIEATKADMERPHPMDRLVCGDVGYGKTEVAIRAAFKAIADHKQVALIAPTTLLADQHLRTFSERFAGFPIRIAAFSRYSHRKDLKENLQALAEGRIDLAIGTHRLLQKDVAFGDLGLIIVDEEQRFGVMHKERLKQYRTSVDVLTLSATPIPRTLHMALVGVRDLSVIRTAPKNRLSVKTLVVPASEAVTAHAIAAELDRGGQVYYLHNRIDSIYALRNHLAELVPRARIAVAHGQMHEREVEPIMNDFLHGRSDVLVATTIIENGLDIPNVNTMIVDDADRFGLAQLYQLRGRVGRSNQQAYCYLLYQGHKALSEEAQARLEAIVEFTHLGSGMQIAMRDLEIRGAGNLLGSAQSGFIASVGFDTYCQLLADAISARRGAPPSLEDRAEAVIDVKISAYIPNDYIPQVSQKIAVYQQLAKAREQSEVDEIAASIRDRFGPFPAPLERLVELTRLRTIALRKRVTRVVVDADRLTLGVGSGFQLDAAMIPKFQSLSKNRFRFSDGKVLVDLPHAPPGKPPEDLWMPLLRKLLEAM